MIQKFLYLDVFLRVKIFVIHGAPVPYLQRVPATLLLLKLKSIFLN